MESQADIIGSIRQNKRWPQFNDSCQHVLDLKHNPQWGLWLTCATLTATGFLTKAPHYNSIYRLENPGLTPILKSLIEESSLPLQAIESDFAVDSSGFSTSRFVQWLLWRDANHNGVSEPEELVRAASAGYTPFDTSYKSSRKQDEFGNLFRYRAKARKGNAVTWAFDVFLLTSQV